MWYHAEGGGGGGDAPAEKKEEKKAADHDGLRSSGTPTTLHHGFP